MYLRGTIGVGSQQLVYPEVGVNMEICCSPNYMGDCQNYGPSKYEVPYYNRDPKGTIILTTTHISTSSDLSKHSGLYFRFRSSSTIAYILRNYIGVTLGIHPPPLSHLTTRQEWQMRDPQEAAFSFP